MIIKCLTENTKLSENLISEHGLSLYIETNGNKILFDTGQTDAFSENAKAMGIDIADVDMLVLSHGHYDHGGGIKKFVELNKKAPIYVNKCVFEPHYNCNDGMEKYIGLDLDLQKSDRFIFTDDEYNIDENMALYTCNDKSREFYNNAFGLFEKKNGEYIPDDFRHEQYLMINENNKRILISGCSHKGILNIENWFKPDVLVGGFHFMKLSPDNDESAEILRKAAQQLNSQKTDYYTCHCTGVEQYEYLKQFFGNNLHYVSTGSVIEL